MAAPLLPPPRKSCTPVEDEEDEDEDDDDDDEEEEEDEDGRRGNMKVYVDVCSCCGSAIRLYVK